MGGAEATQLREPEPVQAASRRRFPAGNHPWIRLFAILAVVFVLCELWARALSPSLPPPNNAGAGEVAIKRTQMAALSSAPPAIAVLGDSMLDSGVDPTVLDASLGGRPGVYNASLMGARLNTQNLWLNEAIAPTLRPALVIQGVSPTLISSLGMDPDQLTAYDNILDGNIKASRDDVWSSVDRSAADHLALVKYRTSLRNPRMLLLGTWARISGAQAFPDLSRPPGFWEDNLRSTGQVTAFEPGMAAPTGPDGLIVQIKQLLDSDLDTGAYDTMLATYAKIGLPVVVVIPPVALDVMASSGVDVSKWQAMTEVIKDRAASRGVTVIDFTDEGYTRELFFDPFHLNEAGNQRFSRELGQRLSSVCAQGTVRCER